MAIFLSGLVRGLRTNGRKLHPMKVQLNTVLLPIRAKGSQKNSSNVGASKATAEVNSPVKNRPIKRKDVPRQEYRRVNGPLLLMDSGAEKTDLDTSSLHLEEHMDERNDEDGRKKKKPTPDNLAEAAGQPCLSK